MPVPSLHRLAAVALNLLPDHLGQEHAEGERQSITLRMAQSAALAGAAVEPRRPASIRVSGAVNPYCRKRER